MADRSVLPGLNTIQPVIAGLAQAGDRLILADGTYTFNATGVELDPVALGKTLTGLTIMAENYGGAIIVMTGCPAAFCQCRGVESVTWDGLHFTGNPNGKVFDDAGGAPTGWVWKNLLASCARTLIDISTTALSMVISDITTTASYTGPSVVQLTGVAAVNSDALIKKIDARIHGPGVIHGVRLVNMRDVRTRELRAYDMVNYGFKTHSDDDAIQVRDIIASNIEVRRAGLVGIHIGNTATVAHTSKVYIYDAIVEDTIDGYGIEFENLTSECELVGYRIERTQKIGVALAEDTENILVTNGLVDTVGTPGTSSGVVTAVGRRHRIHHNTFTNVTWGITIAQPLGFSTPEERNLIRENIFVNTHYVYRCGTTGMPSGQLAHMLGPNIVLAPTINYSTVNEVPRTKAEFEALFPDCIDEPDIMIDSIDDLLFFNTPAGDYATYRGSSAEQIRAGFYFTHPHLQQNPPQEKIMPFTSGTKKVLV